jgi:hypothetical protein
MCVLDWGGEPIDEEDLVVSSEDKVEKFNQNSWVVFTDVGPSIVLASLFVAALPPEVVGES